MEQAGTKFELAKRFLFVYIAGILFIMTFSLKLLAGEENKLSLSADFYGSHDNLMPYPGYEDDLSGTIYLHYGKIPVQPFVRYVDTHYYYQLPATGGYTTDHRTAAGLGFDIILTSYLRLRLISEYITNDLSGQSYQQASYGAIYNQYLDFSFFELNNYAESFYIPRVANELDTFVKIQALKSFYLTRSEDGSQAVFPFIEFKGKYNDDAIFGISGQNASVGAGYKFYHKFSEANTLAFVLEGHSVFYQSRDFNGDWYQTLAAIQWLIN